MTSAQGSDDVGSIVGPTSSLACADVILADFQGVISRYLQTIRICFFYTAARMWRTIVIQNSKLIRAWFSIKIDEVWIDRFCVRYNWWRRLQPTSSVSPVCKIRAKISSSNFLCICIMTLWLQIYKYMIMTWLMTSPGHKIGQLLKFSYLRQYLNYSVDQELKMS